MLANFTALRHLISLVIMLSFGVNPLLLLGQNTPKYMAIAKDGTMKWVDTGNEINGFGVNYTVPFAHAYRKAKELGVNIKEVIDQDVAQFARLGLDLFRVHVWDCEISDTLGNLLVNEHLDYFDYLIFKLKEHKIKSIITPIAYWGNGWPDPDEKTPGFSTHFGKELSLVHPQAIEAQKRYIQQFISHYNPYTGLTYKDDPDIILFEISNEPHHRGSSEEVQVFINVLAKAFRDAGNTKPVFYNVTHSVHLADAYAKTRIDGGTFQWYPTGLGYQQPITGNMLPHVDNYAIPFGKDYQQRGMGRIVYEFDAADMLATYIYPAMARSFRTAGMQLATHFSYDPTFLAPYNTEYNTHFMNLAYTPGKAIGLMISAEIFRQMPRYRSYGSYPNNTKFGAFSIYQDQDLAEMITPTHYYYTNHSKTQIQDPKSLGHIAGVGNSTVVRYNGTGAYFLDKIAKDLWVLELYPDVNVFDNVFSRYNSIRTPRAQLIYKERDFRFLIPGMESISALDISEGRVNASVNGSLSLKPGRYIISNTLNFQDKQKFDAWINMAGSIRGTRNMNSLSYSISSTKLTIDSTLSWSEGFEMPVRIMLASPNSITKVVLRHKGKEYTMTNTNGFTYSVNIPGAMVKEGDFKYEIQWQENGSKRKSPEKGEYVRKIIRSKEPLPLLDDHTNIWSLQREWISEQTLKSRHNGKSRVLDIYLEHLIRKDPENPDGTEYADYSVRLPLLPLIAGRKNDLPLKKTLVVEAASEEGFPMLIGLAQSDGSMVSHLIHTEKEMKAYRIPLENLKPSDMPLLPRPYPTFLPYYFPKVENAICQPEHLEALILSFGPGIHADRWPGEHHWTVGRIWLE